MPNSEHENPSDGYDRLPDGLSAELDPVIDALLKSMHMSQEELNNETTDDWDDLELASRQGCAKLNGFFDSLELMNDPMTVYGKVRLAPWLDDEDKTEMLEDPFFRQSTVYKSRDERGEYWQVAAHTLHMCPIDTDQTEDHSRPISYVMTFRTPYCARELETNQEDPAFHGELIMYPDDIETDIEAIKPSRPSIGYAKRFLTENYPAFYQEINELLPEIDYYTDENTPTDTGYPA